MPSQRLPTVSVVMPVRNEARTVAPALLSVLSQDYASIADVIVADGRSTDGTRDVVRTVAAGDARVRLVDNPAGTTPAALNTAIRASTGEIVVRVDAHAVLPDGYVRRAVEVIEATGADNVGGMQVPVGRTPMKRAIAIAMSSRLGAGDARYRIGGPPGPVDTVYLGAFRRTALERVGGFDEDLLRNQDAELNHRIRASGGVVYFHPDLRVGYEPRDSFARLWQQYFTSGAWKRETFRKDPRSFRPRQAAPPLLVLGLAASAALAVAGWRRAAAIVPGTYAAALAGTTALAAARRRDPAALLLPAVLPAMHLGWGLGFLLGRSRARKK